MLKLIAAKLEKSWFLQDWFSNDWLVEQRNNKIKTHADMQKSMFERLISKNWLVKWRALTMMFKFHLKAKVRLNFVEMENKNFCYQLLVKCKLKPLCHCA